MRRHLLALLVLFVLASTVQAQVPWAGNIDDARAMARQTNRLVLLHFWAPSCPPCVRLEREVYEQPGVGNHIASQFVPVKVNAAIQKSVREQYGVDRWPTDVIIDPNGKLVAKQPCPINRAVYLAGLTQAVEQHRIELANANLPIYSGGNSPFAAPHLGGGAVDVPGAPQANSALAQPAGQAYEAKSNSRPAPQIVRPADMAHGGFHVSQQAPPSSHPPFQNHIPPGKSQISHPAPSSNHDSVVGDRYTSSASQGSFAQNHPTQPSFGSHQPPNVNSVNPAPPANTNNLVGDRYSLGSAPAPARGSNVEPWQPEYELRTQPAESRPPFAGMNSGTLPQIPARQPPIVTNPPRQEFPPQHPPRQQIPAQQDPAPLVLDGTCPVTLVETERWVPGDKQYGAVHRGRTYLFVGPGQQKKFFANPDKYSPVLAGNDPVLAIDQQRHIAGRREHGLFYGKRVFLFSSEETLSQFYRDPHRYADIVRQAEATGRLPLR